MGSVKDVQSASDFNREVQSGGDKLIIVHFFASWIGHCRAIEPFVEELSSRYPQVTFLKVDVDQLPEVSEQHQIEAMPTFVFIKNRTTVDTLRGADRDALEAKVQQFLGNVSSSADDNAAVTVKGYMNLAPLINKGNCECLNESDDHTMDHMLNPSGGYLASDTDEQLIMYFTFNQVVKLHSLRIVAPQDLGPKNIKLFVNQTSTPDFDACEGSAGIQEFDLSTEDLQKNSIINLRFVKFQNVNTLTIFVKDNQCGGDVTRIDHLAIIGNPVNTTNMGEFKRVAGKKGEVHG